MRSTRNPIQFSTVSMVDSVSRLEIKLQIVNQYFKKDSITLFVYDVNVRELAKALHLKPERCVEVLKTPSTFQDFARNYAARMLDYGLEERFWNLSSDLFDVVGKNKERRIAVRYLADNTRSTFRRQIATEPFETLKDYKIRTPGPIQAYLFVDMRRFPTISAWEVPARKIAQAVNVGCLGARGVTATKLEVFRETFFNVDHIVQITTDTPRKHFAIFPNDFSELEKRYAAFD